MGTSPRFDKKNEFTPGPGNYKTNDELNDSGLYRNSNKMGQGRRVFGNEVRKVLF